MNKIVRAHYPVSHLPEDLRQGLDPAAEVTVIIEEGEQPDRPMTIAQIFAARQPPYRSAQEIDQQIGEQRDGWND